MLLMMVFLPGGSGLLDPCEKEPIDAVASLSLQQREDITNSAQVYQYYSVMHVGSTVILRTPTVGLWCVT